MFDQLTSPSARQQGLLDFQDLVGVIPFLDGMVGTAPDKLDLANVAKHVVVGPQFVLVDVDLALFPRSQRSCTLRWLALGDSGRPLWLVHLVVVIIVVVFALSLRPFLLSCGCRQFLQQNKRGNKLGSLLGRVPDKDEMVLKD